MVCQSTILIPELMRRSFWGSLSNQLSLCGQLSLCSEFQTRKRPCLKLKVDGSRGMSPEVVLWPLHAYSHVYIHAHVQLRQGRRRGRRRKEKEEGKIRTLILISRPGISKAKPSYWGSFLEVWDSDVFKIHLEKQLLIFRVQQDNLLGFQIVLPCPTQLCYHPT